MTFFLMLEEKTSPWEFCIQLKHPSILKYILDGKKVKAFSLRSGIRQGSLLLSLLYNTVLEIPARTICQEKEVKSIKSERKNETVILADDAIRRKS